jgi:hypothetical protein
MNNREHAALYDPSYQSIEYAADEDQPPAIVFLLLFRLIRL